MRRPARGPHAPQPAASCCARRATQAPVKAAPRARPEAPRPARTRPAVCPPAPPWAPWPLRAARQAPAQSPARAQPAVRTPAPQVVGQGAAGGQAPPPDCHRCRWQQRVWARLPSPQRAPSSGPCGSAGRAAATMSETFLLCRCRRHVGSSNLKKTLRGHAWHWV